VPNIAKQFQSLQKPNCHLFLVRKVASTKSSYRAWQHCGLPSRSRLSPANRQYLVHSELKILFPVIELFQKLGQIISYAS